MLKPAPSTPQPHRLTIRHLRRPLLLPGLMSLLLSACGAPSDEEFSPSGRWRYAAGYDTRGGTVQRISVSAEQAIVLPAGQRQTAEGKLIPLLMLECHGGHWQASMRVGDVRRLGLSPDGRPVAVAYRGDHASGSSMWVPGSGVAGLEAFRVDFLPALRASERFSFRFDAAADVREISFDVTGAQQTISAFEQRCNRPPGPLIRLLNWFLDAL